MTWLIAQGQRKFFKEVATYVPSAYLQFMLFYFLEFRKKFQHNPYHSPCFICIDYCLMKNEFILKIFAH